MIKSMLLFVVCCSFVLCPSAFAASATKAKQKKGVAYWHKALKHKDKKVRAKAAKKTIPVLVAALASSHIPVYYESAVALGKIGGMAVPALRPVFFGNNSSHRAGAARALGFIGKPAIPMLLEGLKHKKWGIRWRSAMALGRMGTQARPAIPALRKAQKDKTLFVSKAATKAIKSISGK